jgi:hypothetical protein
MDSYKNTKVAKVFWGISFSVFAKVKSELFSTRT